MENKIMLDACHHFISERVFPIFHIVNDKSAFIRGTGFLIEESGILYLITARHVLEEESGIDYAKIVFPIFGQFRDMYSLPHAPYFSVRDGDADFAIVPLQYDEEILTKIYWKAFTLDSFYMSSSVGSEQAVFVHGFPRSLQHSIQAEPFINVGLISFITNLFSGDVISVEGYQETIDILFNYKSTMTINGEEVAMPDLRGISGSPIFCIEYPIDGIWSAEKYLKIIGLEKAVKENSYIRATKSSCIKKSIAKWIKNIKEDLEEKT